jgi:hypothetical protein
VGLIMCAYVRVCGRGWGWGGGEGGTVEGDMGSLTNDTRIGKFIIGMVNTATNRKHALTTPMSLSGVWPGPPGKDRRTLPDTVAPNRR